MKHRKLRIAWSVAWGIAAVLLLVLWARSYWTLDIFNPFGHEAWIARGRITIDETWVPSSAPPSVSTSVQPTPNGAIISEVTIIRKEAAGTGINMPIGVPTAAAALLIALPWLPWRFSLRTLLIAITLVAMGLGIIVWLSH